MKNKSVTKTTLQGPDDFTTVWEYLSSVREAKGYTIRVVIDSINQAISEEKLEPQAAISRGYLSNLESGKYLHPSPFKLKGLAEAYNIPYELLLNKAGYLDKTSKKIKEDAAFTLMLKEVQDMTVRERQTVLDYIEYVKSRRNKKYDKSPKKG